MSTFIFTLEMAQEAIGDNGTILGFTQTRLGSIGVVQFNKPITITRGFDDHEFKQLSMNGYASGICEWGPDNKHEIKPFSVCLRGGNKKYFVSEDKRTFVFSFSLFHGHPENENKFMAETFEGRKKHIVDKATIFFDHMAKYGMNVWQEEHFISRTFNNDDMNKELLRMAEWWSGLCVKLVT